jgi:hypothetical protein
MLSSRPGNAMVSPATLGRRSHAPRTENKRGILPDIVVADELVLWYASCLVGSYSKAVQQVTTRPTDATWWR